MKRYNPKEIEPRWQKTWADDKLYEASEDSSKPKKYILEYFPYPSGAAMHVGHVRNYTIGDALTRFARMRGYNVLHPMGWDAFGLPAENYAIKTGISPQEAITQNTTRFKQQLTQMGFGYDWSREFASSDPDYYKWTQWFFLLLHRRGLAYRQESLQWWCPFDKTVLANEQVENGRCWRCGNQVEKKALKQWFFKITDYADRLVDDLEDLNWTDSIKNMQRNWIGRSKGGEVSFTVADSDEAIRIFTTRPDTLYGATFLVLAPEHPLVQKITTSECRGKVMQYVAKAQAKSDIERQETDREKTGAFTGAFAVNPANNERIPIWVADYVLYGYGTGAIMAVPAHDARDREFASKFKLPIVEVVEPQFGTAQGDEKYKQAIIAVVRNPKTGKVLVLDWGPRRSNWGGNLFIGGGIEEGEDPIETAKREITEETGYVNVKHVKTSPTYVNNYFFSNVKNKNYHARFLPILFELTDEQQVERQLDHNEDQFTTRWVDKQAIASTITDESHLHGYRLLTEEVCYSGEGIIINSGVYNGLTSSEVRDKIIADLVKQGAGKERVNYKIRDWLISRQRYWGVPIPMIHCPKCGIVPVPENQLPVVLPDMESFESSGDGRSPLARVPDFVDTTCPQCDGAAERETDTMDGFACSSWYFLRFADPHNADRPFDVEKVKHWLPVDDYIGGAEHAVMHLLYARMWTKVMQDEGLINFAEPFKTLRNQGMILAPDGQKMSKSKGNTIEPDGLIDQGYGADAIRIMELFIGPWNQSANWSIEGMGGSFRFLQRVWTLAQELSGSEGGAGAVDRSGSDDELKRTLHRAIHRVSRDLEEMGFNTAIAALMETVNELYKLKTTFPMSAQGDSWRWAIETLLQLLAPFAPHITEELWYQLGHATSIHISEWPIFDKQYLVSDKMTIVVQVNGKLRAQLQVATNAAKEQILEAAQADLKVAEHLKGKTIKKQIYVPGKLVNFVV